MGDTHQEGSVGSGTFIQQLESLGTSSSPTGDGHNNFVRLRKNDEIQNQDIINTLNIVAPIEFAPDLTTGQRAYIVLTEIYRQYLTECPNLSKSRYASNILPPRAIDYIVTKTYNKLYVMHQLKQINDNEYYILKQLIGECFTYGYELSKRRDTYRELKTSDNYYVRHLSIPESNLDNLVTNYSQYVKLVYELAQYTEAVARAIKLAEDMWSILPNYSGGYNAAWLKLAAGEIHKIDGQIAKFVVDYYNEFIPEPVDEWRQLLCDLA